MPLQPLKIERFETGLVQDRQQFALPDDAFPQLVNAYVFRERIQRKYGTDLIGRLRRCLTSQALGNTDGSGNFSGNIVSILSLESEAQIESGSLEITVAGGTPEVFTEPATPDGTLVGDQSGTGTINYSTSAITLDTDPDLTTQAITADFCYFPTLPVMGICNRDLPAINDEESIIFDTKYAYTWDSVASKFKELPSTAATTWTGTNSDFFWCANYWNITTALLLWATNASGTTGDPIRYYNGGTWTAFGASAGVGAETGNIGGTATGPYLNQSLILIPFRSRLLALNTFEGATLATSTQFQNRIRWCQIGNPLVIDNADDAGGLEGSWRSNIRGKGGFIDLPTNEAITSVGLVRDNLIVHCERSTWKLRYTGQAISPFAPEKVNTELGVESTHSTINFDTSTVGIGDKGIIQCDSYKADRIDIKIPDLVHFIQNENNGVKRIWGLRDFIQRTAYWIYPSITPDPSRVFPDKRLVYNYENDSWAIFEDSFTALGNFYPQKGATWSDINDTWGESTYPWQDSLNKLAPEPAAGNQKGYISYIDSRYVGNDESLPIEAITQPATTTARLTIVNHNLTDGQVIQINGMIGGGLELNGNNYEINTIDANTVAIFKYSSVTGEFTEPEEVTGTYLGLGEAKIRDNINILTKKFNFMNEGRNTVFGYLDILTNTTEDGAFTMFVYVDYDVTQSANFDENNVETNPPTKDSFFNTIVSTQITDTEPVASSKTWQRVFANTRGRFISLRFTLSPEQMNQIEQESDIQIDALIPWLRPGGTLGF